MARYGCATMVASWSGRNCPSDQRHQPGLSRPGRRRGRQKRARVRGSQRLTIPGGGGVDADGGGSPGRVGPGALTPGPLTEPDLWVTHPALQVAASLTQTANAVGTNPAQEDAAAAIRPS